VYGAVKDQLAATLTEIEEAGLYKRERELTTAQSSHVATTAGEALNFCANNYLGFADHPDVVAASRAALDEWGFGMASVRFICGTQTQHTSLEARLSQFLGTEATILFSSCFDANGGVFEVLLDDRDAVISDELNHASIIDGIRLCKARRLRYRNRDMADLEEQLKAAADARRRLVVTDGVFSMDGYLAQLDRICDLAERHDALVMVDDSHSVGVLGAGGRGTHEHHDVVQRIDILTGTLGKAIGGASGGYVAGRREIVELLRQRARPYLFSNSIPPAVAGASLRALELIESSHELRNRLRENTAHFRSRMTELGFDVLPGEHPIVPVMSGDEIAAARLSAKLVELGVYAVSFSVPVVPRGTARIRTQMSAAHTREDLDFAADRFADARAAVGA
jgi:glycine C-acetyltransferase